MNKKKRMLLEEQRELITEIEQTKRRLQTILLTLEYLIEPDLIDCYTYELKATEMRYRYLLRIAKNMKITCNDDTKDLLLTGTDY